MDDIPDKIGFLDFYYFIDYHEDPFYDKVVELERLSLFSCNPDIFSSLHIKGPSL